MRFPLFAKNEPVVSGGEITFTYIGSSSLPNDLTTFTFPSTDLGASAAGKKVVVCIAASGSNVDNLVVSCTVNGTSASIAAQEASTDNSCCCIAVADETAASGDIVVQFTYQMKRVAIFVYTMFDAASSTPYSSDSDVGNDPATAVIDVPAGGAAVACAFNNSTGATITWTGLTEDDEVDPEGGRSCGSASDVFLTTQSSLNVVADFVGTSTMRNVCACSWEAA